MGFFKKIKKIFSSKKTDQKDLKKQSDPAKEELLSKKINQEEGIANQIKSYDSK